MRWAWARPVWGRASQCGEAMNEVGHGDIKVRETSRDKIMWGFVTVFEASVILHLS